MKVRHLIDALNHMHVPEEEVIVTWWARQDFADYVLDADGNEFEQVPVDIWNAVANRYEVSEFELTRIHEDITDVLQDDAKNWEVKA